ncbi:MAG: L-serine ammonia-lyase, iron-sulfur-dependent, subunit alpha [Bacillales bacterium]|jgi:L-serine dehydratase|nr:L-serine ammonia-lyase, iron-sulfur-dependent, subunit alpha [Bacillales bacterium]
MKSIRDIYKVGFGPSSSHTIAPAKFAQFLLERYQGKVTKLVLFNSFQTTGNGHLTFDTLKKILTNIQIQTLIDKKKHPLHMEAYIQEQLVEEADSIGGGNLHIYSQEVKELVDVYPHKKFTDIINYCQNNSLSLLEYIDRFEPDLNSFLTKIFKRMVNVVEVGLKQTGYLPGSLKVSRKAKSVYEQAQKSKDKRLYISAYALAVSEENANGQIIVTAPTCGSCGVVPAILYYSKYHQHTPIKEIINALKVAGLIANLVASNGTLSGAIGGCQVEIGTAIAMASSAYAYLQGNNIAEIESAAELAIEHHLGLTCDPIKGYVQIPCIERNAIGALRALDNTQLGKALLENHLISLDTAIASMYQTGLDIKEKYKETSRGGLAKYYQEKNK